MARLEVSTLSGPSSRAWAFTSADAAVTLCGFEVGTPLPSEESPTPSEFSTTPVGESPAPSEGSPTPSEDSLTPSSVSTTTSGGSLTPSEESTTPSEAAFTPSEESPTLDSLTPSREDWDAIVPVTPDSALVSPTSPPPPISCGSAPCFPGVLCTDINASIGKFVCGACPEGYSDLQASNPGIDCADVDECADTSMTNGGCDPLTECTNTDGGRACSACPEGYLGDGASGCRVRAASCLEGNGGCDPLTNCTVGADGSIECSDCPAGYAGTGFTACTDLDGCAAAPCFPGTPCADVAAPGVGFTCGECPTNFWGNGINCELDKCLAESPPCSALVTCTSTPGGGATCSACPTGYDGDGTTCDDVDECANVNAAARSVWVLGGGHSRAGLATLQPPSSQASPPAESCSNLNRLRLCHAAPAVASAPPQERGLPERPAPQMPPLGTPALALC
ncbi:hypothetical protein CYMTET_4567 [Cymbomonas tetramitiformis]|uniref:EGF-like domain-containing protein n=1 Tax=Cymbomonas tetramitiformis TaxID=36881 RepID=A0AAE0LKD7_9CHLO|nr:hypothetical protein CYMTET_4567 [Cymbomonas tetramitiformis]